MKFYHCHKNIEILPCWGLVQLEKRIIIILIIIYETTVPSLTSFRLNLCVFLFCPDRMQPQAEGSIKEALLQRVGGPKILVQF